MLQELCDGKDFCGSEACVGLLGSGVVGGFGGCFGDLV